MDKEHIKANLARHGAQPHVSSSSYFYTLCSALGREVVVKTRIYLDSCYWIMLREASLGKARQREHTLILGLLRELVEAGQVICPVSDAVYVETMQHADQATRLATAALLDDLSRKVCLRTERERVSMELAEFMRSPDGSGSAISELVWVRPGMMLGVSVPSSPAFDEHANLVFQKSSLDLMWSMSFRELANRDRDDDFANLMEVSATNINEKIVEYAPTIRSFQQAFAAEVSGAIKFFDDDAARLFLSERVAHFSEADVEKFKESMQTMLFNAFRLRPKMMARRVPTLYVHAACHAAIRWDKSRKFNGHWLMDLHHASAAGGYHHAMFTETPLKVLMTSGNLKLDEEFNMHVMASAGDALHYLQGLQSSAT
jgi:hypothetical protein